MNRFDRSTQGIFEEGWTGNWHWFKSSTSTKNDSHIMTWETFLIVKNTRLRPSHWRCPSLYERLRFSTRGVTWFHRAVYWLAHQNDSLVLPRGCLGCFEWKTWRPFLCGWWFFRRGEGREVIASHQRHCSAYWEGCPNCDIVWSIRPLEEKELHSLLLLTSLRYCWEGDDPLNLRGAGLDNHRSLVWYESCWWMSRP